MRISKFISELEDICKKYGELGDISIELIKNDDIAVSVEFELIIERRDENVTTLKEYVDL